MHAVKSNWNLGLESGILVWNLKSFIKKPWDFKSYTRFQLGVGPLGTELPQFAGGLDRTGEPHISCSSLDSSR